MRPGKRYDEAAEDSSSGVSSSLLPDLQERTVLAHYISRAACDSDLPVDLDTLFR
jgi:hypothetical protein